MQFPSEWQHGKPRGSVKDQKNGFMAVLSPPNEKQLTKYFAISSFKSKNHAFDEAKKWVAINSNQRGLTRNQIRYIDRNTIEVKLTNDQIMITDAKFLDKVQLYPLQAKSKKLKNGTIKYYVIGQDKKKTFQFTNLICNFKVVEYINGNNLDLREVNLKEFGSIKSTKNINKKDELEENNIINNQYNYFKMDINLLPKNIWLLGKPAGTIFKRKDDNIWTVRVNDEENIQHTKTFKIENYKNENDAWKESFKWQMETSYKLNQTKNLIKIIDENTIEIKLTKDKIMKTNKIFIPLIQKIPLFIQTSGNGIMYAATSLEETKNTLFHSLITTFPMTDHINGDTLDNQLSNLRPCDYSLNNSNRHKETFNVTEVNKIFGDAVRTRIKIDGQYYEKNYVVKDQNKIDVIKNKAQKFRQLMANCEHLDEKLYHGLDKKLLQVTKAKLIKINKLLLNNINLQVKNYLPNIDLKDKTKFELHDYYTDFFLKEYDNCLNKIKQIDEIL